MLIVGFARVSAAQQLLYRTAENADAQPFSATARPQIQGTELRRLALQLSGNLLPGIVGGQQPGGMPGLTLDQPPIDAAERGKQMRFLMARGFGAEAIRRVVGGSEED